MQFKSKMLDAYASTTMRLKFTVTVSNYHRISTCCNMKRPWDVWEIIHLSKNLNLKAKSMTKSFEFDLRMEWSCFRSDTTKQWDKRLQQKGSFLECLWLQQRLWSWVGFSSAILKSSGCWLGYGSCRTSWLGCWGSTMRTDTSRSPFWDCLHSLKIIHFQNWRVEESIVWYQSYSSCALLI